MAKRASNTDVPWRLYAQDCLTGIPHHIKQGLPTLAALDPPYNIGQPYSDYVDTRTQREYVDYLGARVARLKSHMHPHGSMWIAINDANLSEVDVMCKGLGLFPRRKVIWHYTFGQNSSKNFTPSHITWLYYTLHRTKYTFNHNAIRIPSARQLVYNDKRANSTGRLPDDVWVLLPAREPAAFKPLDNTWLFSRVCGTFNAKIKDEGIPNQMPVAMMDRIIRLCSNPGDTVVDIFNGTGTTGRAALIAGRRYIGFDVSKKCIAYTEKSFRELGNDNGGDPHQMSLFDQPKASNKGKRKRK